MIDPELMAQLRATMRGIEYNRDQAAAEARSVHAQWRSTLAQAKTLRSRLRAAIRDALDVGVRPAELAHELGISMQELYRLRQG